MRPLWTPVLPTQPVRRLGQAVPRLAHRLGQASPPHLHALPDRTPDAQGLDATQGHRDAEATRRTEAAASARQRSPAEAGGLVMGLRVTPEGSVTHVFPESGMAFKLEELYRHTDCDTVDIRRLVDRRWLVCDDNGHLKELPLNPIASYFFNEGRGGPWAPIVGTVLLAEFHEVE